MITFYFRVPPLGDEPCRFVNTLIAGHSPVEALYAGVGSQKGLTDVVPFRLVCEYTFWRSRFIELVCYM